MRQLKISKSITNRESQSVEKYLQEIGRVELITAEEEVELAKRIKKGDQIALEKLVNANLRFVVSVAKQYQNQGLTLNDLINEGNVGLVKAAQKFDETRGFKFISYAVWWIRQSILQSLNENARTIRLPVNVVQDLYKAKKDLDLTGTELPEKLATLPQIINLDRPLNEDGDTLLDVLNNPNADLADSGLSTEDTLKEKLLNMLNVLDEREKIIIEDYFGLSGTNRTLEDIGNDFDLTKERVRQIKEKALRKLRNETSVLFEYL
jgi:RNA polymerase primary sigma factor